MDFSTTIYDSTAQDNFFSLPAAPLSLTVEQTNRFLQQLLTSIDPKELAQRYHQQLQQYLPVSAMWIDCEDCQVRAGERSAAALATIRLPLESSSSHEQAMPQVVYHFTTSPNGAERALLKKLHGIFSQPFNNALDYLRLKRLATKDSLTRLGNRNGFNEQCQRLLARAERQQSPFGLLVIDLDNFKAVNDRFGHAEGDRVLMMVADEIRQAMRLGDEAYRFGGDEFCCLLPDTDHEHLSIVAQRLSIAISSNAELAKHMISCSIGGACYRAEDDREALFNRADLALYAVKHSGKNAFKAA